MSNKKIPDCKLNKLIMCENTKQNCQKCGWHPKEIKRRNDLLNSKGLSRNKDGKSFLHLSKGDAE